MMNCNHYPDIDQEEEFSAFYLNDSNTNDNDTISIQKDLQSDSPVVQAELLSEKLTKNMER